MTDLVRALRELRDADPTRDLEIHVSDPEAQTIWHRISPETRSRRHVSRRIQARARTGLLVAALGSCVFVALAIRSPTTSVRHSGGESEHYRLAALERQRGPADVLPANVGRALAQDGGHVRAFGLRLDNSRRILSHGNAALWLVPGAQQTCLVETVSRLFAGASCSGAGHVTTSGLAVFVTGGEVVGILPSPSDDPRIITSDGSVVKLQENGNGGISGYAPQGARAIVYRGIGDKSRYLSLLPRGSN